MGLAADRLREVQTSLGEVDPEIALAEELAEIVEGLDDIEIPHPALLRPSEGSEFVN